MKFLIVYCLSVYIYSLYILYKDRKDIANIRPYWRTAVRFLLTIFIPFIECVKMFDEYIRRI